MLDIPAGISIEDNGAARLGGRVEVGNCRDDRLAACAHSVRVAEAIVLCDGVIDLTAVFFNISGRDLRSSNRTSKPVSRVRQIGMYVAHVTLGLKMTDVGAGFGRDKSTVVHACHTIEDMREDEDFDLIVARVEKLVLVAFSLDRRGARRDG